MPELSTRYEPSTIEDKWYKVWEKSGSFKPESGGKGPAYSIVIPPPNITGQLHVGHALNHTIQDVLIRHARKQGKRALWLPGTDHAGIATQAVVEKLLKEEGVSRFDLGREKFVKRIWQWKEKFGGIITRQMRTLGLSVDWSRERFTMDDGLSYAVRTAFTELYKKKLIYRDTRMIMWDPVTRTVLSDLEVDYDENHVGELYSFAYPLKSTRGEIVVATTRPETMLGDSAIAVHPDDPRYKDMIGKTVMHPFLEREVPIIADSILVDPAFGTGAVKVTPAHDVNDYETGKRHNLEFITIFDESGKINEAGGRFKGLDRYEARKQIKASLLEIGLERGKKEHKMALGKSQRSGAVVEPMVSTQWFVKVRPLADQAIKAVEKGKIKFYPENYTNLYNSWMREIRDWCISRQLWWGHQIPAYHCEECAHITVSVAVPKVCEKCKSKKIKQDPDVLDTWFSSGLWPFSTMGWPGKTKDLATFYPTTVLVTAYDIIFFWVARMVMMGLFALKKEPFGHVYIHGLMRDEQGRKISKSLGNNIDPADVIKTYGADAYRFFLMATLSEGKDSTYSENRLKGYQSFANKVWNSSRFVLMNLPKGFKPIDAKKLLTSPPAKKSKSGKKSAKPPQTGILLEQEDWWILDRLNQTLKAVSKNLAEYKFHLATENIYEFIWNDYCDWYIEFIKPRMFGKAGEASAESARQVSFYILNSILSVLNPFMPYLTEELYAYTSAYTKPAGKGKVKSLLIGELYPALVKMPANGKKAAAALELLQRVIGIVRNMRAELKIAPDKKIKIIVKSDAPGLAKTAIEKQAAITRLAQAESIQIDPAYNPAKSDAVQVFTEGQVCLPVEGLLDIAKEEARIRQEIAQLGKARAALESKLGNQDFVTRAPAEVVNKEKAKLQDLLETIAHLEASATRLGLKL
ncbi:MAG: valine--tRNA ligase [Leptospirales bacterium]|nr:valine--tRNA ligase [Leptospirales bacterium]